MKMCDPNDNGSDLILDSYGSISSENKPFFTDSEIINVTDPTKHVHDLSILGLRKRKAQELFTYHKDCKVQRKSVDKIHLSINSSSLNSSPHHQLDTAIIAEDDDTEKYLTNSSKKNKEVKRRKPENEKTKAGSDSDEAQVFSSPSMQVVTDDYGELVVTLYPSSEAEQTIPKNQNVEATSASSYLKEDQPTALFLPSDYLNADENTDMQSQSMENPEEDVVYTLIPPTTTASNPLRHAKTALKHTAKLLKKHNQMPSAVPESVKDPVRNVWVTVKEHKEQLKQCGHTWTKGTWSNEEVQILKQNIKEYCEKNNIKNVADLIFTSDKEMRKDFYPSLCVGLNRPLFAVYRRVKRMFDKRNHKGKYSEEEVSKLKELRKLYGRDWSVIGQELGRSSDSVKDRCRLIKDDLTTGRWTSMEEKKLDFAVHAVTNTSLGESVTEGISWPLVAEIVKSRTEKQCRTKWLNYLNWKMLQGEQWTKNDDKSLVDKISELNVTAENEIDWFEMCEGWKSARSPQWLRLKWNCLKKQIADIETEKLTFKETVGFLKNHFSLRTVKTWDKPKNSCYKQESKYTKINPADLQALRNRGVRILSKEDLELDDSSNITTSIISQSEDTTSAPLFIQTTDPDHLVSQEILNSSPTAGNPRSDSLRFRIPAESSDGEEKSQFSNSLLCEEGENQLPIGTYHLTSTSSDGIYIIQAAPDNNSEEVTLTTDDDRFVNITFAPEVFNTMLKLNGSKLADDDTEVTSSGQGDDVTYDSSVESVYLTQSTDSPVLGSVAQDITIGSPDREDPAQISLLRESSPLTENLL